MLCEDVEDEKETKTFMGPHYIQHHPPCFGRHVKSLVSATFAVGTYGWNPRVVGYDPFLSIRSVPQHRGL
jgi:hypothetical protein